MTGIPLIVVFVLAIVVMIVAISKYKIHPFLSIMTVSLVFGIIAGVPIAELPKTIGEGFSGRLKASASSLFSARLSALCLRRREPRSRWRTSSSRSSAKSIPSSRS